MSPVKEKKEIKKVQRRSKKVSVKAPATKNIDENIFIMEERKNHSYGLIAKSVSIACVIMTALVISISPNAVWILGPIIGAMTIFGIAMGYFASK